MIKSVCLVHPQSVDLLKKSAFRTKNADCYRIACGTTRPKTKWIDFYESADFSPSYASWNSCLFETSVILTCWEHADDLFGNNDVAFIHSDVELNKTPGETWKRINSWLREDPDRSVGLTAPLTAVGFWDGWVIPSDYPMTIEQDPFYKHSFGNKINVWDYIKKYEYDLWEYGMDVKPKMIYSHQFACTRKTFDYLGNELYNVVQKLRLGDVGLWTPHMFERIIALLLAKHGGEPILSTAFWHHASSAAAGPGDHNLYGPRAFKYYKICTRANAGSFAL